MRLTKGKDVDVNQVIENTGIKRDVVEWILDGNPADITLLKRVSSATGLKIVHEPWEEDENVFSFNKGDGIATATLTRGRLYNKLLKLSDSHPGECSVLYNDNGVLCAQFPMSWMKLSPKRVLSEEAKEKARERAKDTLLKQR